jgi:hypothetical protein
MAVMAMPFVGVENADPGAPLLVHCSIQADRRIPRTRLLAASKTKNLYEGHGLKDISYRHLYVYLFPMKNLTLQIAPSRSREAIPPGRQRRRLPGQPR